MSKINDGISNRDSCIFKKKRIINTTEGIELMSKEMSKQSELEYGKFVE